MLLSFALAQILDMDAFKQSKRISVYLSLTHEVNTQEILSEMFRQQKEVSQTHARTHANISVGEAKAPTYLTNMNNSVTLLELYVCRFLYHRTVVAKWLC